MKQLDFSMLPQASHFGISMGVPLNHPILIGFSSVNHPAIGTPMETMETMETLSPAAQRRLSRGDRAIGSIPPWPRPKLEPGRWAGEA